MWAQNVNQLRYSKFQIVLFSCMIFWILMTLNNTVISKCGTKNWKTFNILIPDGHTNYFLFTIFFYQHLQTFLGHWPRPDWKRWVITIYRAVALIMSDILVIFPEHFVLMFNSVNNCAPGFYICWYLQGRWYSINIVQKNHQILYLDQKTQIFHQK